MIDKINDIKNDIKRAVEAKAYLAALALALTLPDICGKIVQPELKVGERYRNWFDSNVSQFYGPHEKEYPQLTGEICYKLRCAFLHSGNIDGIPIDQFDLCIEGCDCFGATWSNSNDKKFHIRVNVEKFCLAICDAAEKFYIKNKENYNFSDAHITIINIQDEVERIERLNQRLI